MSIFEYNEEEEMRKLRKGEQEIGEKVYGQVPEYVKKRILEENDIGLLSAWLKEAAKAESIEDFQEKTGLKEPRQFHIQLYSGGTPQFIKGKS